MKSWSEEQVRCEHSFHRLVWSASIRQDSMACCKSFLRVTTGCSSPCSRPQATSSEAAVILARYRRRWLLSRREYYEVLEEGD